MSTETTGRAEQLSSPHPRCVGCGWPIVRGRFRAIAGVGSFHEECCPPRWPVLAPKPHVSTANE